MHANGSKGADKAPLQAKRKRFAKRESVKCLVSTRKGTLKPQETIEVVLGGGAVRGLGLIGLLQALEEHNVATSTFTGVSIGSLVATLYTNGYTPEQITEIFLKEIKQISSRSMITALIIPFGRGQLDLRGVFAKIIKKYKLKPQKNLRIVAYSVLKRQPVVFEGTDYDLLTALSASCAIPFLMRPVWYGQKGLIGQLLNLVPFLGDDRDLLVDGGIYHPAPAEFSKGRVIIGKLGLATQLPRHSVSISELFLQACEMVGSLFLDYIFPDPEGHIIVPVAMPDVGALSFGLPRKKGLEMVKYGYAVAMHELAAAIKCGEVPVK